MQQIRQIFRNLNPSLKNYLRRVRRWLWILRGKDLYVRRQIRCRTEGHGSDYGGWHICPDGIDRNSIVYSFGVGEDISFDLSLIATYGMPVYAFDPTPKSLSWLKKQSLPDELRIYEIGIADFDGVARFFPPENPAYVSHSVLPTAAGDREFLEVPVKTLNSLVKMLGHSHIDILKMDIEGAEYAVLEDILQNCSIPIGQILVEFHHRFETVSVAQTRRIIERLNNSGYKLFHVSKSGEEYGFIRP